MSIPSPDKIAKILTRLSRATGTTENLALIERLSGLKRLQQATKNTAEGKNLAQQIKAIETKVQEYDLVDDAIRVQSGIIGPSMSVLRLISMTRGLRQSTFSLGLSQNDRLAILHDLFERIIGQSRRGWEDAASMALQKVLNGYRISTAGVMREVVGRNLAKVAHAVRGIRLQTIVAKSELIDSSLIGAVRVPTRWKAGDRTLALGPDRLVGMGRRLEKPLEIEHTLEDGTSATFRVVGELEPRIIVEVKGRTTATDGIRQFVVWQRRGDQGYVLIGNEFWLIKNYRADRVEYFLVAPAGEEMARAIKEAETLRGLGIRISTVEIAAKDEAEIVDTARQLVQDVANHVRSSHK